MAKVNPTGAQWHKRDRAVKGRNAEAPPTSEVERASVGADVVWTSSGETQEVLSVNVHTLHPLPHLPSFCQEGIVTAVC